MDILAKSPKSKYSEDFLTQERANDLFSYLNSLKGWKKNEYKGYKLARETIVFAIDEIVENPDKFMIPDIWGKDVVVMPFPEEIKELLNHIREFTKAEYNIALGNRYLKAKDKIAFHSDNEEFGNTQSIASLSLGVSRTFTFIAKAGDEAKHILKLKHGSLLFMGEHCQENYTHGMEKERIDEHPLFKKTRINVTFRVWNYTN